MSGALLLQIGARAEVLGVLIGAIVIVVGGAMLAVKMMRRGDPHSRSNRINAELEAMMRRSEERARMRAGKDAGFGPMVEFEFHTYQGFLVFFTQLTHRPRLPKLIALEYLRALHLRNLKMCLIPYPGTVFVPLLSWIHYQAERRKILRADVSA